MFELFVLGSFWFWALIALEIFLLFMFVEYENGVSAAVSLAIFGCILQFFGDVNIIGYVMANPTYIFAIAVAYFSLGAAWGIVKWYIFCTDKLQLYKEAKADFLEEKGLPSNPNDPIPVEHRVAWKEALDRSHRYGKQIPNGAPLARKHKATIVRWMSFWPISLVWSLINDFVKRICNSIYLKISTFLQRVSDNIFSGIQDDLDLPNE